MFVGPVTPDLEKIAELADSIPKGSCVLELGGYGTYSVSLHRRTDKLVVIQPDARLLRCLMVNAELSQRQIQACNAWVTERNIIMFSGQLKESDGNHHPDDELNLVKLSQITEATKFEFTHLVVHRPDFLEQFQIDYPDFVAVCTVLKTYSD